MAGTLKIFTGSSTQYLAGKIAQSYGIELGRTSLLNFSDGEFQVMFDENIRGINVFIVQSTFAPSENIFELLMLIDAAKRASAQSITVVIPYFGYGYQNYKYKPRIPITAKLISNMLEIAGTTRIITLDLAIVNGK